MVTVNVVVLAGTVAAEPVERRMPSGDEVTEHPTLRPRGRQAPPPAARSRRGTPTVGKRALKGIAQGRRRPGARQLVRRFYRSGAGARSLTEVVATGIKKLEPAVDEDK